MGDTEQVEREVEHLRVVITKIGSTQPDGKSESEALIDSLYSSSTGIT